MTALVIDANVWVSAADPTDVASEASGDFLKLVADLELPIALPAFARLEVACALARRKRSGRRGRRLTDHILESPRIMTYPTNRAELRQAVQLGTRSFLRAGDSLYAALAEGIGAQLVSWDRELIERAGAITPWDWIERRAGGRW